MRILLFYLVFAGGLLSCSGNEAATKSEVENTPLTDTVKHPSPQTQIKSNDVDSIKKFVVDDYPVPDEMFGRDSNNNGREILSGDIRSLDMVWFSNDVLNQTLVFELHTDNFRMTTFHFSNRDIPKELIKRMELSTGDGEPASDQQKEKYFKGFINFSKKVNKNYFVTNKGFRLGDKKQKALDFYGKPDKITRRGNIETDEWDFIGDILYDGKTNLKGKALAENNFGHQITMFFRDNKLIGLIFHNDIP